MRISPGALKIERDARERRRINVKLKHRLGLTHIQSENASRTDLNNEYIFATKQELERFCAYLNCLNLRKELTPEEEVRNTITFYPLLECSDYIFLVSLSLSLSLSLSILTATMIIIKIPL